MKHLGLFALLGTAIATTLFWHVSEDAPRPSERKISFNKDIRPILNKNCTGCHGGVGKQANVSFIYREEALGRGHSGRLTITPGKPDSSELIARVESKDPNTRMPYRAPPLPQEDIQLLRDWIEQGAEWEEHWAFVKPAKANPPSVNRETAVQNAIDNFIQAKLEAQNLSLAAKADKAALLRRLSLDLTGLPPTIEEIDAFIADTSANAYEKQVDRLLASPHYGERWAAMWMDLARYADSWGFTRDEERESWPYKQWVIESFNSNKPYDEFVIEQLAGDLLPDRNLDQLIATGFHRQTPANSEGGTDDEEYRMMAVMDRNATTWSVLNAMTINCVQCHSHPYDPIEHGEYFQSLSYFNTTHDADFRDYKPLLKLAKKDDEKHLAFEIQERMFGIQLDEAQKAHELAEATQASNKKWKHVTIDSALGLEAQALRNDIAELEQAIEKAKSNNTKPNARKVEFLRVSKERLNELVSNNKEVRTFKVKNGEYFDEGSYEAEVIFQLTGQETTQSETISSVRFSAIPQNPNKAKHTPEKNFYLDNVKIFVVKPDATRQQVPVKTYLANATETMDTQLSKLGNLPPDHNGLNTGKAAGWFAHRLHFPRWTVAVLESTLTLEPGDKLAFELYQSQKVVLPDQQPNRVHRIRIEATHYDGWQTYANSEKRQNQLDTYTQLRNELKDIDGYMIPVMLEQERWNQRETALFNRGNFMDKVDGTILPRTPNIFGSNEYAQDRLGLARWFFGSDQPLTARVTVNRFWHRLFGIGIVKTLEDFGSAGSLPSHPELLDWLAIEFQHNMKWDVKALLKLMVMSRTYQQDSAITPELFEKDPENELFARGPRRRLSAEMIRDQALVASDLITHEIGGEPAMPPQPADIWGHQGVKFKDWQESTGANRYRRAAYTFVRRAFMYPSFLTFDMETREISHERRIPTNTPLQALVTLNDPVYHEAAQALGNIMLTEAQTSSATNAMQLGFKRVVSRLPTSGELKDLMSGLEAIAEDVKYNSSKKKASQVQDKDESHLDKTIWTAVGSVLLNLDSALTR